MGWGAIAGAIGGNIVSNLYDDYRQRKSDKRQYKYNSWLQEDNQAFQKYMAQNAHQMEMEDLKAAGLNPALTAMGSTASSIAGSSAAQGTSAGKNGGSMSQSMQQIVDNINSLRQTNANITNQGKEADAALKNAEANYMSAQANMINAGNNTELAEGGWGSKVFGTKSEMKNYLPEIAGTIGSLAVGGGFLKGAWKLGNSASKIVNIFRKAQKVHKKVRIKR